MSKRIKVRFTGLPSTGKHIDVVVNEKKDIGMTKPLIRDSTITHLTPTVMPRKIGGLLREVKSHWKYNAYLRDNSCLDYEIGVKKGYTKENRNCILRRLWKQLYDVRTKGHSLVLDNYIHTLLAFRQRILSMSEDRLKRDEESIVLLERKMLLEEWFREPEVLSKGGKDKRLVVTNKRTAKGKRIESCNSRIEIAQYEKDLKRLKIDPTIFIRDENYSPPPPLISDVKGDKLNYDEFSPYN